MLISEAASSASRHRLCEIEVNETGTIDTMDGGIPSFPSRGVTYVHRTSLYSKSVGRFSNADAMKLELSPVSRGHLVSALVLSSDHVPPPEGGHMSRERPKAGGQDDTVKEVSKYVHTSYLSHRSYFPRHSVSARSEETSQDMSESADNSSVTSNADNVTETTNHHPDAGRRRLYLASSSALGSSSSSSSSSSSRWSSSGSSTSLNSTSTSSSLYSAISSSSSNSKPSIKVKKDFGSYGQPRQRAHGKSPKSHWVLPEEYSGGIQVNSDMLNWVEMDESTQIDGALASSASAAVSSQYTSSPVINRFGTVSNMHNTKRSSYNREDLPPSARLHQKALHGKEGDQHFSRWMNLLRQEASRSRGQTSGFLELLFGNKKATAGARKDHNNFIKSEIDSGIVYVFGRYSTLISVKLSKMLMSQSAQTARAAPISMAPVPVGVVLSLLTDSASWGPHRDLVDAMGLLNNVLCHGKLSLETLAALTVAPEHPDLVLLQLDIFTSLLQESLAHRRTGDGDASSAESLTDDTLGLDTSAATFVEEGAEADNQAVKTNPCSHSFDILEEAIASAVLMGDNVYVEVPNVSVIYSIIRQLAPSCMATAEARYSSSKELLAAVSRRVILSKHATQYLCEEHMSVESRDDKCIHMEVRAVEEAAARQGERHRIRPYSTVYKFSLAYYSPFDFQLLRNATKTKHIQNIRENRNSSSVQEHSESHESPIEFSVSLKELRTRLRNVRMDNNKLTLWPRQQQQGVSVYTLLHLQVEPALKRILLKQYIDFPFIFLDKNDENSVTPWNVFARFALNVGDNTQEVELSYHPILETVPAMPGKYNHAAPDSSKHHVGVSSSNKSVKNELQTAQFYFDCLNREFSSHKGDLAQHGQFSFVEHNSEYGFISALVAQQYSNASVVSLERNKIKMKQHVRMLEALKIENNVVCSKGDDSDSIIFQRIYESPELFRYQLVARGLLESFANTDDMNAWGSDLGCVLSSAVTTFLAVPSSRQVSLAMGIFFPGSGPRASGPYRPLSSVFSYSSESMLSERHSSLSYWEESSNIKSHPTAAYRGFETLWLLGLTKAQHGSTEIMFTPVYHESSSSIPLLIRCDIVNMTRHVHHHYDYAKDGHSRTYTMRVEVNRTVSVAAHSRIGDPSASVVGRSDESDVLTSRESGLEGASFSLPLGMHPNQHQVVSVNLLREKDSFPIPYTSIYGITLISILRLGIDSSIRDRLFKSFLFLPLYEDMAPWNIVLMGKEMAYIDYDTRDMTFDLDIPKAYQVISVLMNYKRTVEDFKRCGKKANTVYGLAFISDCVGEQQYGTKAISCPNLKLPVPCGDGTCHSDYISCLRSYSDHADALAAAVASGGEVAGGEVVSKGDKLSIELAEAMRSGIGLFSS